MITGFVGMQGGGKTLIMTLFLYMESLMDNKVFANYKLLPPLVWKWLNGKDMVELSKELSHAALGVDEIHLYADSRSSSKKQNKSLSYFITQCRKRSNHLYWTSQFEHQVDRRIRDNTQIKIICEDMEIDSDNDGFDDMFRLLIQDKRRYPPVILEKKIYATPIFNWFDTNEVKNPFEYSIKEA